MFKTELKLNKQAAGELSVFFTLLSLTDPKYEPQGNLAENEMF